uniref:Solute carrier family 40 protein n=2 Tax=Trichuris muris TaxID=70415 RepID=A0A5S6Q420_TRIMR
MVLLAKQRMKFPEVLYGCTVWTEHIRVLGDRFVPSLFHKHTLSFEMANWLKNFLQISLSEQTEKDIALIEYPKIELGIHIAFKLGELGTFAGSVVIAPLVNAIRTAKIQNASTKFGTIGLLSGICFAPIMEALRLTDPNVTPESIEDRCYRLRYNKKQLFIDRSCALCGLVGFSLKGAKGMVFAIDAALIATILYNHFLWDRIDAKLKDKFMEMPAKNPRKADL